MYVQYSIDHDRFCISRDSIGFDFSSYEYELEYTRYILRGVTGNEAREFLSMSPLEACFEVTNKCNYKCPICIADSKIELKSYLSLNKFIEILNALPKSICRITFTGGEPLLHPDLNNMIEYAVNSGYKVLLSTNGFSAEALLKCIRNKRNIIVAVSLHGLHRKHDTYVGKEGAFSNAVESIICARKYTDNIHVYTTLSRVITDGLIGLVRFVDRLPIREHRICLIKKEGRIKDEYVAHRECVTAVKRCLSRNTLLTIKSTGFPFIFINSDGIIEVRNG